MPDRLRWLDWHARQLMLNELLRPASRTFQAAATLAQIEARAAIDALVAGAEFAEGAAAKLFERHLIQYFADRQSVGEGKSVSLRVDLRGRRTIKKNK